MVILFSASIDAKPRPGVSFGFFYSSLRSHGEWIEIDNDIVAWRPFDVDSDWRPYTRGRWSWTNNGWYWDSYEPFGWATYHYGRWYDDDYYGWIWIPDYEWGPSWVEWRYNDDYIGWAPLPPYASFNINLGIRFSIGWNAGHRWWNFVSYNRFCHSNVHHYLLDYRRTSRIFGSTKYRNNYYFERDRIVNGGLDRSFVEGRGGYRISEREIRSMDNREEFERNRGRDDNDRIYSYRPTDREISRSVSNDKFEIKRGNRATTIERDKLSTPKFTERDAVVLPERNREKDSERNNSRDEARTNGGTIRGNRNNEDANSDRQRESIRSGEDRIRHENERREVIRESETERARIERRTESERPVQSERRIERKREESTERPSFRTESRNERSSESRVENRSERESRGTAERRR